MLCESVWAWRERERNEWARSSFECTYRWKSVTNKTLLNALLRGRRYLRFFLSLVSTHKWIITFSHSTISFTLLRLRWEWLATIAITARKGNENIQKQIKSYRRSSSCGFSIHTQWRCDRSLLFFSIAGWRLGFVKDGKYKQILLINSLRAT